MRSYPTLFTKTEIHIGDVQKKKYYISNEIAYFHQSSYIHRKGVPLKFEQEAKKATKYILDL